MASGDYASEYTGQQIDTLLGKVTTVESGLSSLSSTVSTLDAAVTDKVDKEAGKGLSSNDYTNSDKAKLSGLPTGSEINTALAGKASASTVSDLSSSVAAINSKIPSAASSSNQLADKYFVNTGLSGKQATLVSGTNIKTINNESILGSGNIVAGDPNAVKYVAQTLTASQKEQARENIGAASAGDITGQYYGFYTSSSSLPTGMSIAGYAFVGSSEPFAVWNYNGSTWSDSGATVNAIQGEPGVGFASVSAPSTPDGTMLITLTNGDTITIDMNHNHPAYPKYVYLTSESQMPSSPESDTLYLILESQS